MVRVIAGEARRLQLKTLDGYETRPTQDIIKETLFNTIQTRVPGAHFLDLFAGSGSIGIEALSRGASKVVFVDNNRSAVALISENLEHTHLTEKAEVYTADAFTALRRFKGNKKFDIIYLDPPYKSGLYEPALKHIRNSSEELLNDEALIIVEALRNTDLTFIDNLGYTLVKEKDYKRNRHLYLSLQ